MKGSFKGLIIGLSCFFVFASPVIAHRVTIFAWAEGDTVFTQSKFSGGKRVQNGKVEVFDSEGTLLLEGRTDANGEFSFNPPKITDLTIVLTAGMGHQNRWMLSATELGQDEPKPAAADPAVLQTQPETAPLVAAPRLTAQAVETIVARQLDQKLKPLTRMIVAAQESGPKISDIFGGIGYIIGLVGLGSYVHYRKGRRRP